MQKEADNKSLIQLNPLVSQLWASWGKYGFQNEEEAHSYTSWILRAVMQTPSTTPTQEIGYNGLKTTEEILQRYPIDEFRADRDVRQENVKKFSTLEEAAEFLREIPEK